VFGVVVLTTLLHVARGVISIHARTAKTLLVFEDAADERMLPNASLRAQSRRQS
jgi:hypothetical protein